MTTQTTPVLTPSPALQASLVRLNGIAFAGVQPGLFGETFFLWNDIRKGPAFGASFLTEASASVLSILRRADEVRRSFGEQTTAASYAAINEGGK